MERFSITFILVAILAASVFSTRPETNYYRRHSQKRQAYYGNHPYSNNGNTGACGITINVGSTSNGCNCACAPQGGEGPAPAPSPSAEDPIISSEPEVHYPPSSAEECGSQNPFCDDELAPAAPAELPTTTEAASEAVTEGKWIIQFAKGEYPPFEGEFCKEREWGCLTCGTRNATGCEIGDGNATRGRCVYEWTNEEYRDINCIWHPICNQNCSV